MADLKSDAGVARSKVVLVGFRSQQDRYEAVKKISELLGLSFDEAADLADSAPVDIIPSIPREAAQNLAKKLNEAGALAEVLAITKTSKFCDFHPHKYARGQCKTCGKAICNICLIGSKGKQFCAEHFEIYKQKRVLRVVGGIFLAMLVFFLGVLFRHPIIRFWKNIAPTHELQVLAMFVAENPSEDKSAFFMKSLHDNKTDYLPGDDHTVASVGPWFNARFREMTGSRGNIMRLMVTGLYKIDIEPPMPPERLTVSYKAWQQYGDFKDYFNKFLDKNLLSDVESSDIFIMIDLVDRTGIEKDFMENIGFAAGPYAFVKFPVKERLWSNDYYIAAVAHYIGRCMGGTIDLNDKGFPKNPEGLAEPAQRPRYAQPYASLMACYRPVQEFEIERPSSLDSYAISPISAFEFGWISRRRIAGLYPGN